MHGHPHAKRQGLLALGDVAVADAVRAVGGDPEGRVEPVEGLLGVADRGPLEVGVGMVVDPVAMVELVGQEGLSSGQVRTWGWAAARWATA
jgi:hypothetical protein